MSEGEYRRPAARASAIGGYAAAGRFRGEQFAVSAVLKEMFDGIAAEPLPSRIAEVLRRLDAVPTGEATDRVKELSRGREQFAAEDVAT